MKNRNTATGMNDTNILFLPMTPPAQDATVSPAAPWYDGSGSPPIPWQRTHDGEASELAGSPGVDPGRVVRYCVPRSLRPVPGLASHFSLPDRRSRVPSRSGPVRHPDRRPASGQAGKDGVAQEAEHGHRDFLQRARHTASPFPGLLRPRDRRDPAESRSDAAMVREGFRLRRRTVCPLRPGGGVRGGTAGGAAIVPGWEKGLPAHPDGKSQSSRARVVYGSPLVSVPHGPGIGRAEDSAGVAGDRFGAPVGRHPAGLPDAPRRVALLHETPERRLSVPVFPGGENEPVRPRGSSGGPLGGPFAAASPPDLRRGP